MGKNFNVITIDFKNTKNKIRNKPSVFNDFYNAHFLFKKCIIGAIFEKLLL